MEIKDLKVTVIKLNDWEIARKMARVTVNKSDITSGVSDLFKKDMCISEHSPLREVRFLISLENCPKTVISHFVRHRVASNPSDIEHYVNTDRPDRTGEPRDAKATSNYTFSANVQGLISMSRKRICQQAEAPTRFVWSLITDQIREIDIVVFNSLVPECIYRGFCPEKKSCGYDSGSSFKNRLYNYRSYFMGDRLNK